MINGEIVMSKTEDRIFELARACGFSDVGICRYSDILPLLKCSGIKRIPENAKSVIVGVFAYGGAEGIEERNVAEYAVFDDYHIIVGDILAKFKDELEKIYPNEKFKEFVDNSPVDELKAGVLAGLGDEGKNGLLIHKDYGMRVFIGEIVTSLKLEENKAANINICDNCGACIKACPAGALGENGRDMSRCLSGVTQRKGELAEEEKELLRVCGKVWGCDACIEACPQNREKAGAKEAGMAEFLSRKDPKVTFENYRELLCRKAYGYRGEKVMHRNLEIVYGEEEKFEK